MAAEKLISGLCVTRNRVAMLRPIMAATLPSGMTLTGTGSDTTGTDSFSLVASHANVFGLDHQFSGAYTTSLECSSDVKQLGLNYRIPLYRLGGVVGASYTNSDVLGNFGSFSSTGACVTTWVPSD